MAIVPVGLEDVPSYPFDHALALSPWYLGIVISTLIYGIILAQTYTFAINAYKNGSETRFDRIIVGIISFFLLAAWVSNVRCGYWLLVLQAGVPVSMVNMVDISYFAYLFAAAHTNAAGQAFFAMRAWRLNGSNIALGLFLAIGILFVYAAGLSLCFNVGRFELAGFSYLEVVVKVQLYVAMTYIGSACLDVIICALISFRVLTERRGFSETTDSLLARVASMIISTSALTSGGAVVLAVLVMVVSNASYYALLLVHLIPRLFGLSVLFVLNGRELLAGGSTSYTPSKRNPGTFGGPTSGIRVELETVRVTDEAPADQESFSNEKRSDGEPAHRIAWSTGPATPGA